MIEYRVMAYFNDNAPKGYQPRSYKRKVVQSESEARELLKEAVMYYSGYKYLRDVRIETRQVTDWQ